MKDNGGRKPVCAVKGMLAGGRAVCGRVINAKYCGSSDACEHKVDQMKTLTAIPLSELIKKAGSKRKVAQIAGIQNLGSLSHQSVLIDGVMYRPSISTADWSRVSKELVGDS